MGNTASGVSKQEKEVDQLDTSTIISQSSWKYTPRSPAVYRRLYPKEVHQQRTETHLQFFRSASLQLQDLTRDAHNTSPVRKRPRISGSVLPGGRNLSFVSLTSCPEFRPTEEECVEQVWTCQQPTIAEEPLSFRSPDEASTGHSPRDPVHNTFKIPQTPIPVPGPVPGPGPGSGPSLEAVSHSPIPCTSVSFDFDYDGVGPITQQVLTKGLTAKFRSLSAWILTDKDGRKRSKISPLKNKFGGSLSLSRFTHRKRKFKQDSSTSSQGGSTTGSQYSLTDGRTPWPTPWLEAIFLPEYPNKPPVTEKNFSVIGTIASGAFGKVYRVCLKTQPDAVFAMKVQNKSEVISKEAIQQVKDEVSIHETVGRGTFVAGFYASWQSRSKLYTVLQYVMGYGDLYMLWRDYGPFNEQAVTIYIAEIASALDFIHSSGVIYRDLKMENVVLDEQGHVQLVDFGFSKWLGLGDRTATICGTLQYMAPEIAQENPYDRAVDWWALGVLMHVLLTARYPFPFSQASDHLSLRFDGYQDPEEGSKNAQSLLIRLLDRQAESRLQSLDELKTHPFFSSTNFDAVAERMYQPFDHIPKMRPCDSCNSLFDRSDCDTDCEENLNAFDEHYEQDFREFDYFNDKEDTMTLQK